MAGRGLVPSDDANTQRRTIAMGLGIPATSPSSNQPGQITLMVLERGMAADLPTTRSRHEDVRTHHYLGCQSPGGGLKAGDWLYRFARTPEVRILLFPEEK